MTMPVLANSPSEVDSLNDLSASEEKMGSMKTASGEHEIIVFQDTASVTKDVFEFLTEANDAEPVSSSEELTFAATLVLPEDVQLNDDVFEMLSFLTSIETPDKPQKELDEAKRTDGQQFAKSKDATSKGSSLSGSLSANRILKPGASSLPITKPVPKMTYSSIFSMARAESKHQTASHVKRSDVKQPEHEIGRSAEKNVNTRNNDSESTHLQTKKDKEDKEGNQKNQDQEQSEEQHGKQNQPHYHEKEDDRGNNRKKKRAVEKISAAAPLARASGNEGSNEPSPTLPPLTIDNLFMRFMNLMARILGQAEAEAHTLYLKIKNRTDNIDQLIKLISKINSSSGAIDWTENEEMKRLVDQARSIGVDIPEGKYKWSEEEKRVLKENIQMQKDSMDKITQLERTDMQRFLQEASQCHQARSNVLKLLKEILDTIIYNMRP